MELTKQLGEWYPLLQHVFDQPWMARLGKLLHGPVSKKTLAPPIGQVFRAFTLTPPDRVKVVIIGQDPYILGEADGLAFSSFGKMTPSLEILFAEINRTHTCPRTVSWLDDWAEQGVLLLNSVLTTELGKSRAHVGWGWEKFVLEVLDTINTKLKQPMVFMLWGKDAQSMTGYIRHATRMTESMNAIGSDRLVLRACHPQAQNYNPANKFVGCNHFIDANLFLMQSGQLPVWWPDRVYGTEEHYYQYCETLIKQNPYASADIIEVVRSYATVRQGSTKHPHDDGLGSGHSDTLPF